MEHIRDAIEKQKKNFILHNIVRLREMIRYLPQKKLDLFREIPFLIHVNSPEFPAYVKSAGDIFGVWNFENSGFAKDISTKNPHAAKLMKMPVNDPAVQAIYHIGSLGTFTQSAKSDFDFWIIIDRSRFDNNRFNALQEKLNLIIIYSRRQYSQEVSFFLHDAHNLINNQFDEGDEDEIITVPKMLIKEEFYRTFIMVSGRIPLWAVIPTDLDDETCMIWKKHALENREFIDLGMLKGIPIDEIQRGLLWQICKAPYDPVKSLIKATVTASYIEFPDKKNQIQGFFVTA
ncbi:Adenylate cyclase (fragment) [Desulfamplus magnetovallimortis]|uniref:Adenylate cyclase n=1 Tax=Desulfamplus magnetovallimortis TaxID=1246637 RepID=A0A1W1HCK2_9BACT